MNLETVEKAQAEINREVLMTATTVIAPHASTPVSRSTWEWLLFVLFAIIERSAKRSAELSRRFYDEERSRVYPGIPRNDVLLSLPSFDRFVEDMEEVRPRIARLESTAEDVYIAALRAVRTVENAGRWTMIKAVEADDAVLDQDPRFASRVRGWARVATGRETCGWCLMLVSRGAVYARAKGAGAAVSERDAVQMSGANEFNPKEHMHAWHTGCDCKVVPVFDLDDWAGKSRADAAYKMWKEVTKGYSGRDAVNAFRRAAEAGRYSEFL